jgi:hypothetical protein
MSTIPEMVARIYVGLDPSLRGAAGLSVFAHLNKLTTEGRVITRDEPRLSTHFELAQS